MQYVLTFFPLAACDGDVCELPVWWFWFWYEFCWADRPALALMPCGGYPPPDPIACRVLGDACTFRYWQSRSSFLFCRTIAKRVAPNPIAMSAAKIAMLKGTERGCTVMIVLKMTEWGHTYVQFKIMETSKMQNELDFKQASYTHTSSSAV